MKHGLFAAAIALAVVAGTAGISHACGWSYITVSPAPGGDIAASGPVVLLASPHHPLMWSLGERGPVLKSETDEVPLHIVEKTRAEYGRIRAVLVPERPLVPGITYALALTRTPTGFGLNRAEMPVHGLVWTARDDAEAPATIRTAAPEPQQPSLLGRLALFGLLPFFAGYAGVAGLLALSRRRTWARIERL